MKKILLVNKSFEVGGIQSSMINLANELSNYYRVDLFLYNPVGTLRERLSEKVNVIEPSWRFKALGAPLSQIVKEGSFKCIAFKLFGALWTKIFNNKLPINIAIKHQAKLTGYDLAIAYHQEQRKKAVVSGFSRVVDGCVDAKRKVAWMHFDSDTIDLDSSFNNRFYEKMDKIVFVSRSLMDNFVKKHGQFSQKADYCYNFMLYDVMKSKSEEKQLTPYPADAFICFSACRLSEEKGIVRAIRSFAEVFRNNSDLLWYIAGDGPERDNIENTIRENNLEGRIILLGNQKNPYPYMKNASLVLNVSYHEAAPMVFFESKALGTPVFATRTSSAEELLSDNVDSFICENSEEGLRDKLAWIIENKKCVQDAKLQLASYRAGNEESILKIKNLIE